MTIFLVFVIAAVLIGASYYYNKQKTAKLAAEGKIIERKGGFHEQMQEFTLAPVDPALLTQKTQGFAVFRYERRHERRQRQADLPLHSFNL